MQYVKLNMYYMTFMNLIVSILMAIVNIIRKLLSFKLDNLRLHRLENQSLLTRDNVLSMAYSTVLLVLCPYPFLSDIEHCYINYQQRICYGVNDYLHLLQIYKLYFLLKAYLVNCIFASNQGRRICGVFDVACSNGYLIRSMMRQSPFRFITIMFLFGLFLFSYVYQIVESPLLAVDHSVEITGFFDYCWMVILIMTTVGYGDMYPRTVPGRLLTFFVIVYGAVMISLLVSYVGKKLQLSIGELKAYAVVNRMAIRVKIEERAAKIIGKFGLGLFASMKHRRDEIYEEERSKLFQDISDHHRDIINLRNDYKAITDATPDEGMTRSFSIVIKEMQGLNQQLRELAKDLELYNNRPD